MFNRYGGAALAGAGVAVEATQQRAARNFALLSMSIPRHFKDTFLAVYYHGLAQAVWLSACFAFPSSQYKFGRTFKRTLLQECAARTQVQGRGGGGGS